MTIARRKHISLSATSAIAFIGRIRPRCRGGSKQGGKTQGNVVREALPETAVVVPGVPYAPRDLRELFYATQRIGLLTPPA
jgi:hypothetical protein